MLVRWLFVGMFALTSATVQAQCARQSITEPLSTPTTIGIWNVDNAGDLYSGDLLVGLSSAPGSQFGLHVIEKVAGSWTIMQTIPTLFSKAAAIDATQFAAKASGASEVEIYRYSGGLWGVDHTVVLPSSATEPLTYDDGTIVYGTYAMQENAVTGQWEITETLPEGGFAADLAGDVLVYARLAPNEIAVYERGANGLWGAPTFHPMTVTRVATNGQYIAGTNQAETTIFELGPNGTLSVDKFLPGHKFLSSSTMSKAGETPRIHLVATDSVNVSSLVYKRSNSDWEVEVDLGCPCSGVAGERALGLAGDSLAISGRKTSPGSGFQVIDVYESLGPDCSPPPYIMTVGGFFGYYLSGIGAGEVVLQVSLREDASPGFPSAYQALSISVVYDSARVDSPSFQPGAILQAVNGGIGPDFISVTTGTQGLIDYVAVGVVNSLAGTAVDVIPSSTNQLLGEVMFQTIPSAFGGTNDVDVEFNFTSHNQGTVLTAWNSIAHDGETIYPDLLLDGGAWPTVANNFTVTISAYGGDFRRGDCDGSGTVSIADAIAALSYLFASGSLSCLDACDVDDDGAFNIADPVEILGYLFSGGAAPAAPFAACGVDTTNDPLDCILNLGCI